MTLKKTTASELQTSATPAKSADQQRFEAGHGGSYILDPATGQRTLQHATQPATVSNKHPGAPRNLPAPDAAPGAPADTGAPAAATE